MAGLEDDPSVEEQELSDVYGTGGVLRGKAETYETVNHPRHYNQHPAGIEAIEVIEHMSFNVGTSIKHMWRAGLKPGADQLEDLRKAAWYLAREIQRLQKEAGYPVPDEAALAKAREALVDRLNSMSTPDQRGRRG